MEYVVGYLVCSAAAFWLFQRQWRRKFDFTTHDTAFAIFIAALGPAGLVTGMIVALTQWIGRRLGPDRVIWERLP